MSQRGAWRSCRAGSALGRAPGATCPRVPVCSSATAPRPCSGHRRDTHRRDMRGGSAASSAPAALKFPSGCKFVLRGAVLAHRAAGVLRSDQNKPRALWGARSWYNLWQVSAPLQSPKQGDSVPGQTQLGRGDGGGDARPGARPEGQGHGCHKGAWWLSGAGKNNRGISPTALG